jgi:hypothetical protein
LLPLLSTFLLLFTSLSSGFYLPYPPTAFGWEISFIFLYAVVEMIRLFQGWLSVFFFLLFFFLFLRSKHTGSPLSSFFLTFSAAPELRAPRWCSQEQGLCLSRRSRCGLAAVPGWRAVQRVP